MQGQLSHNTEGPACRTLPGTLNGSTQKTCLSGNNYTVSPGDTCHSIALSKSMSESSISALNNLLADCSQLEINATIDLCLPETCNTYTASDYDNCWNISLSNNITFPQFLSYNPAISRDCANLHDTGSVVCISSPDGTYTPIVLPGSNSSKTGVYADSIVSPPGPTPFGTTPKCGQYYLVQIADICSRISLTAHVPVDLFQAINPSINADCTNLIPDLWYCIHPTLDWYVACALSFSSFLSCSACISYLNDLKQILMLSI